MARAVAAAGGSSSGSGSMDDAGSRISNNTRASTKLQTMAATLLVAAAIVRAIAVPDLIPAKTAAGGPVAEGAEETETGATLGISTEHWTEHENQTIVAHD